MTDMPSDAMLLNSGLDKEVGRKAAISSVSYIRHMNPDLGKEELMALVRESLSTLGLDGLESQYTHKLQ